MNTFSDDSSLRSPPTPVLDVKSVAEGGSIFDRAEGNSHDSDLLLVGFGEGGDLDPRRWSRWYRHFITILAAFLVAVPMIASTVQTAFKNHLVQELNLNQAILNLAISHFEICFCVGPLIWGPLSERYGRKPILLLGLIGLALFQMGAALSHSAASLTLLRILAGLFGAAVLPLSASIIVDIWEFEDLERMLSAFIISLISPPGGAYVGGLMAAKTSWGWRETLWVLSIAAAAFALIVLVALAETHRPTILVKQARQLRKETHDHRYRAPLELIKEGAHGKHRHGQKVAKPITLLTCEPALVVPNVYIALTMACLSIYYDASARASQGYTPAFLSQIAHPMITVGLILGSIIYGALVLPRFYQSKTWKSYRPARMLPEERLKLAPWAGVLFAGSLFWFGWAHSPGINAGVPVAAGLLVGTSSFILMTVIFTYVVDVYEELAATAIGCCLAVSNVFTAIFPLLSEKVFSTLGVHWTSTLAGCAAVAAIPIALLLVRYGATLRARSRYT